MPLYIASNVSEIKRSMKLRLIVWMK